jgi:hypothetical protein
MSFLEPCLSFKVRSGDKRSDELEIELAHEFRPSWAKDIDQSAVMLFLLSEIDLSSAADSLEHQLSKYPQRTERRWLQSLHLQPDASRCFTSKMPELGGISGTKTAGGRRIVVEA